MRMLVLGGTGFLGAPLVRLLETAGHEVAVFHRGAACPVQGRHIHGDRRDLMASAPAFARLHPEVVIDLIAGCPAAVRRTLQAACGNGCRVVVASSMDVYRAWGIFHGTESGPLEPVPLQENSRVRERVDLYPASLLQRLRLQHAWMEEGYDKVGMERAVWGPRVTLLRLPLMYGPGDWQHRLYPWARRMRDGRGAMLLERGWAAWRSPRGYVENMAAGVALAAASARAAGRVYNLADRGNYSEAEWAAEVGRAAGWAGRIVVVAPARMPAHLRVAGNTAQQCPADTSRIRSELGFREPVALPEALAAGLAWEEGHPPGPGDAAAFDYAAEDAALRAVGAAAAVGARRQAV